MIVGYWIIAGLLALVYLTTGAMKIARPKDTLASSGMAYVGDFSATQVKLIGVAELLGAIGLILPKLLGILPVLSPISAIGLVLLMIGAIGTHVRRHEQFIPPLVLALLAVAAAVLGFLTLA